MKAQIKRILKKLVPESVKRRIWLYREKPMPMNWTDAERQARLTEIFESKTGRKLDWDNLNGYSEKIQWYKLYYDHPDLSRIVDKVGFKKYIEEKLGPGHTIPMFGAWKTVESIPWDELPQTFVLKSNCQSDGNFIKFIKHKDEVDFEALKAELREWLKPEKTLLASFCSAYYSVTPMILAEEYKENIADQLYDYKIYFFAGEPACIYVASEHFDEGANATDYPISFFDFDWNLLDIRYEPHTVKDMPRPKHLDEMIRLSKELAQGFPLARIDFFDTEEKLYLAEMTFYPGGGYHLYPPEVEADWGKRFVLPPKKLKGRTFRTDLL